MDFWIKQQAIKRAQHVAVTDGSQQLTYQQLYQQALALSFKIKTLQQQRIGLYINNSIESVVLIHACWLAGVEIAMINTRLTKEEIIKQMMSVDISTILITIPLNIEKFNIFSLNDLNDLQSQSYTVTDFELQRIASIMFTSGTTGPQKAVPQTFANHLASAKGCKDSLGYDQYTKWLSVLPIYHISGLSVLLRAVIEGFTVRIVGKFETDQVLHIICSEQITHVSLVPQTLKWLMDKGLTKPYSLQKILLGGAKLSQPLIQQALSYQLPIYNSFGMTETCSQFLTATPNMLRQRFDTVGKPSDNVKVAISHPNAQGHGELLIKGDNVMQGYLYPQDITDTFEDGYFKTGDIAEIDKDGYVMIYDRRKDLIISGGENIYPYQIETVAKQMDYIEDAVCIPVADDTWGQVPKLYYVAKNDISEDDLTAFFNQKLAKYKVPKYFARVTTLPYTSTGKLQRNKLTQQHGVNDEN
ncbi:o-succinylbenzoate--CoA ligase [Staphylococcus simiae]|uniref:o-succinylbenzoate--CoA ligase n=1 Tax=Staphylococcus simiae TaxID=308354 RepID=UPI001A96BFDD|nr:o-succinylbenzoate--CoA ligase [Staphylococcus simiae]MBO1199208.1 o-succinylbenzoate--CoA ligase [Staphylococcus simiae]MBO1201389.1 o-succinylbenzoate--CoA ligase [Staphylococcus simiae]MBO1203557.1 o-succinylbenzoate--CoA ligase [Staphylococcus simiae]MBO1211180.1 o-succinylbenzoate--CoA ligase [Staphylococcus simiae]MBO1229747.1 o-succinylbenzoate--CoA ligase [Staphylococcus simiae]